MKIPKDAQIVSVWLKRKVDQIFQFITLKPWKH